MTAVIAGVSHRHGAWHDLDHLVTSGHATEAEVAALAKGGLARYSVMDKAPRDLYASCVTESLEKTGTAPAEVDAVVLFSSTFSSYDDHGDVIDLCQALGMRRALPLGLFLGQCTNYSQALMVAQGMLAQGMRRVVLLGSDALDEARASRVLEGTRSVFSDTVMSCVVGSDLASGYAIEHVDHLVESELSTIDPVAQLLRYIDLFAKRMGELCARTRERTGHAPADYTHLVLANLTTSVLKNYAAVAGVPFARVPTQTIAELGHCFAYDQLITLDRLGSRPGDLVHVLGVGATYLFSSTVLRTV
ncbi:3-oxoacyl-[acyl-carrier-protein] synthase III C-terminal domain-containing protein [Actinokineospora sp. 24-640]